MTKLLKVLTTFALILGLAVFAFGQERNGGIEGTVTDVNGAAVPDATINIVGQGFTRTLTTDGEGFYRALEIPPQSYNVTATAANFGEARVEQVQVLLGRNTPVNFSLAVGAVGATVSVSAADVAPIDTTESKVQTNITTATIENLPKGTNFASLLQVAPGLRTEAKSGEFQVDGASGSENTFIIDGQEVTNFRTGTLGVGGGGVGNGGTNNNNIPFQFVQEVQVKSNGTEAEFGGALGGVINVVTKSGGNDFHGEFGMAFQPSELNARPRAIQTLSSTATIANGSGAIFYIQPRRDNFLNTYPSATLSGPVFKNRLYFLASATPQFFHTRRDFIFNDGSAQSFTQNLRQDYGFVRLDGTVTDKLRVFGTYTYNPARVHGLIPTRSALYSAGTAGVFNTADQAQQGGRVVNTDFTVNGVYTPTSTLVFSARTGRNYLNEKGTGAYGVPNAVNFRCITKDPNNSCGTGFSSLPINANFVTNKDISIRKTFDGDVSYQFNLAGRHQLKGGFQRNQLFNDVDSGYVSTGEIRLFYGRTISAGDAAGTLRGAGPGEAGYGYLQLFGTSGKAGSTNLGFYAQDTYQPINRLTLNLGLRIERENVPSFSANAQAIKFGFGDKIAPRLGFAYDVLGNGKLKVFGFYGRFYDRFKYELPRGSFGGDVFTRSYFVIKSANTNVFSYTRDYALANTFNTVDFRVPSNDPSDFRVDQNLKAIRQSEYTAGAEFEVSKGTVVAGRFTRKVLDRTIEDIGISDVAGNEIFYIFNPGFGQSTTSLIPGVPSTPKAVRRYNALELRLDKRFSQDFSINASYTYSRLFGNYSGLASSDEDGRTSPSVNRDFDEPFEKFTPNGVPALGLLSTDRPHVFKLFTGYTLNYKKLFGGGEFAGANETTFKGSFQEESGTPVTTRVSLLGVATVALFGRGDLGRTHRFSQTDFALTHKYRFGSDNRLAMAFDIDLLNAFNQAGELSRFELISSSDFNGASLGASTPASSVQKIFNGGVTNLITGQLNKTISGGIPFPIDARYNQPNTFQNPRTVRFGFRFLF